MVNDASALSRCSTLIVPEGIDCSGFGFAILSKSFLTMDDEGLLWGVKSVEETSTGSSATGMFLAGI